MKINLLDLGASHPWAMPITGQQLGTQHMEGREMVVWARGSIERKQSVKFTISPWQGIGGQAAMTSGAAKYLVKQVEELTSNGAQMPVYIQWNATDAGGGAYNVSELHDGWFIVDDFEPDYGRNIVTALVACRMTVTQVASKAPNRTAISYLGGSRLSNFSGLGLATIAVPINASAVDAAVNRPGGEGAVPVLTAPPSQPEWFSAGATIGDLFKGGVHVYDTINTGANPISTSGGFAHANWVEVFYIDHDFTGDCIVTNGFQLALFQQGAAPTVTLYLWNTALATPAWQQWATMNGTCTQYALSLVCSEEGAIDVVATGGGFSGLGFGSSSVVRFRLLRGRREFWTDLTPQSITLNADDMLALTTPANHKIIFNSGHVEDTSFAGNISAAVVSDYGYGCCFINSATYPFILGYLYQNQPSAAQPKKPVGGAAILVVGDAASLAIGSTRSFGVFAIPYGSGASFSTADLQAEAESGTLGTGWTSVADGVASAGNTAQCAAGTLTGNGDVFGTTFSPTTGKYDAWFRVKVASIASGVAEMKLGIWNPTSSLFVASTTYAPSQISTSYIWVRAVAAQQLPAANPTRFRAVTTGTLATTWSIDEAVLIPVSQSSGSNFPQDIYQGWIFDLSQKIVRA